MTLDEILEKHIPKVEKYYDKYRKFYISELKSDIRKAVLDCVPKKLTKVRLKTIRKAWWEK